MNCEQVQAWGRLYASQKWRIFGIGIGFSSIRHQINTWTSVDLSSSVYENVICNMLAILLRPQYIKIAKCIYRTRMQYIDVDFSSWCSPTTSSAFHNRRELNELIIHDIFHMHASTVGDGFFNLALK